MPSPIQSNKHIFHIGATAEAAGKPGATNLAGSPAATARQRVAIGPLASIPRRAGMPRATRLVHLEGEIASASDAKHRALFSQVSRTIARAGTPSRRVEWPGVTALESEAEAVALIEVMFRPVGTAEFAVLQWRNVVASVMQTAAGAAWYEKPLLLGYGLSEAVGGDSARAEAALVALQGGNHSPGAMRDAFAAARLLSVSMAGYEVLEALCSPPCRRGDDVGEMIQREASRLALVIAGHLMTHWPAEALPPSTLDDMIQTANASLPAYQRLPGWRVPSVGEEMLSVYRRESLASRALVCASLLATDPAAEPAPYFRSAYLAVRNGLMREGKRTDLDRVQGRMARLLTYTRRATSPSSTGKGVFLGRVFGVEHQTPLSMLAAGLRGQPGDPHLTEFDPAVTIEEVANHIERQMAQLPIGQPANALTVRQAVRVAALRYWRKQVQHRVRRIHLKIGRQARKAIAVEAAAMISVPVADIERNVRYRQLGVLNPEMLVAWAEEEGVLSGSTGLRAALSAMRFFDGAKHFQQASASLPHLVSALSSIAHDIKPWSRVRFEDGGLYGPNTVIKETFRLPILPYWPEVGRPSLAMAPDIRIGMGRHAVVEISCGDERSGALLIATTARSEKTLGGVAYLNFDQAFTNEYLAAEVAGEFKQNRTRGVLIRAHSDAGGDWRSKLGTVMATLCEIPPGIAAGDDPVAVWDNLARECYKTPGMAINWIDDVHKSTGALLRAMAVTRESATLDNKFGPYGQLELNAGRTRAFHREKGAVSSNAASAGDYRGVVASGWMKGGVHPIELKSGPVSEISFSSAVLGQRIDKSLAARAHDLEIRLAVEGGRIVPEKSYCDIAFTSAQAFIVDFRRRHPELADSALWRKRLDQLAQGAVQAQTIIERRHMTAAAGRRLDVYRAVIAMSEHSTATPRKAGHVMERQSLRRAMSDLLEHPANWVHDAVLLRHETTPVRQVDGWSWLFRIQTKTQLTWETEHRAF